MLKQRSLKTHRNDGRRCLVPKELEPRCMLASWTGPDTYLIGLVDSIIHLEDMPHHLFTGVRLDKLLLPVSADGLSSRNNTPRININQVSEVPSDGQLGQSDSVVPLNEHGEIFIRDEMALYYIARSNSDPLHTTDFVDPYGLEMSTGVIKTDSNP